MSKPSPGQSKSRGSNSSENVEDSCAIVIVWWKAGEGASEDVGRSNLGGSVAAQDSERRGRNSKRKEGRLRHIYIFSSVTIRISHRSLITGVCCGLLVEESATPRRSLLIKCCGSLPDADWGASVVTHPIE
jgi:hypothetical protein